MHLLLSNMQYREYLRLIINPETICWYLQNKAAQQDRINIQIDCMQPASLRWSDSCIFIENFSNAI